MNKHHEQALEKFMNTEHKIGELSLLQEAVGLLQTENAELAAKLQIIIGVIHRDEALDMINLAESMPIMGTFTYTE